MKQTIYPIGLRVTNVRKMTNNEKKIEGWDFYERAEPVVIEFEDGSKIYASQDPEGNGPGEIFGVTRLGTQIIVTPLEEGMTIDGQEM